MQSDTDFDALLAMGARGTTPPSKALRMVLDDLVLDSEAIVGPRRRRSTRVTTAVALVAASLLGGAVGAQAGGLFRPEPSSGQWSTERAAVHVRISAPSIAPCRASYMIVPREEGTENRDRTQWDQVWSAATRVLAATDPADLQTAEVRERYRESLSPESTLQRTEADIWTSSIGAELYARVAAELKRKGLPNDMLLMSEANDCNPDAF